MLWILLLALPFPYIANTAGWMTAELGRQPWLVYGLMRTADGYSKMSSAGNEVHAAGFPGNVHGARYSVSVSVRREIETGPGRGSNFATLDLGGAAVHRCDKGQ